MLTSRSTFGRAVVVGAALLTSACALWGDGVAGFESARFFETEQHVSDETCALWQVSGLNCTQTMFLCPAGDGYIVFDDIVTPLRYSVLGSTLSVHPEFFASQLRFAISADRSTLIESSSDVAWQRKPEREEAESARHCR